LVDPVTVDRITSKWRSDEQRSGSHGGDPDQDQDALDRTTIETIEELHSEVVQAEAEQRFGLLRGRRSAQLADAQAAEEAFLSQHGFATYNDYRLRIRRSTISSPDPDEVQGEPARTDRHDERNEIAEVQPIPTEVVPEPVITPPSLPMAPQWEPVRPASGWQPAPSGEFSSESAPLLDAIRAGAEAWVTSRLEQAEIRCAEIIDRATREAAELVGRATGVSEMTQALVSDVTSRAEAVASVTSELASLIAQAQNRAAGILEDLRASAERPILQPEVPAR
jgi:hypothetical protein